MEEAIRIAIDGDCIVYPTTTQPALGCIPNSASLDKLFAIKNRPSNMPVSIGVANLEQASSIVELTDDISELLSSFPEGAITLLLPAKTLLDSRLGGKKIAIRVVAHPIAKALLQATGPLTATSANISGEIPDETCKKAANKLRKMGFKIGVVDGNTASGPPSTLISWYSVCDAPDYPSIEVLREGIVPTEEVEKWWKKKISNSGKTLGM